MVTTDDLEKKIDNELRFSSESMYYIRLLSILKIRMLNDPELCIELEKKMFEIN